MSWLLSLLKMAAVLAAAGFLGNWFLTELKRARARGKPWYAPYLSVPGLLIVLAVLLPLILKWVGG